MKYNVFKMNETEFNKLVSISGNLDFDKLNDDTKLAIKFFEEKAIKENWDIKEMLTKTFLAGAQIGYMEGTGKVE